MNEEFEEHSEGPADYSFLNKKEHVHSPFFSVIVIGVVTIVASITGMLAVRLLPVPDSGLVDRIPETNYEYIPQRWIGYTMFSSFPVELGTPRSVSITPDGEFLIGGDSFLALYSFSGELLETVSLSKEPHYAIIPGEGEVLSGNIIVVFKNSIEILSKNFEHIDTFKPFHEDAYISSLSLDGENLYLADAKNRLVYVLNSDGELIHRIGEKIKDVVSKIEETESSDEETEYQSGFYGLEVPSRPVLSVLYDKNDDKLRVSNPGRHRIETFTREGHWVPPPWGLHTNNFEGFSGCCNPAAIALLSDGSIVTEENHIRRIKVYSSDGELQAVVADTSVLNIPPFLEAKKRITPSETPCIAVTHEDDIVIVDPIFMAIRVFRKKPDYQRP